MKGSVRNRAIIIASISACSGTPDFQSVESFGLDAHDLWLDAWRAAHDALFGPGLDPFDRMLDAEAECLLREGWSPGDPVRLLSGAKP